MEIKKPIIRCCAPGRCINPMRFPYFPDNFPCRKFRELVKSGSNPTNCPYYVHKLDQKDIGHNKKSGKGKKRKAKVEQRKLRDKQRKENKNN